MSGNIPYIGSKISLITTSDIRYEGILYTLNREESTIAVQNVRSFGTEGRRCPEVPMSNEIYDFIIFRGKDLKDLTVLQGAPERPAFGSDLVDSHYDPRPRANGIPQPGAYAYPAPACPSRPEKPRQPPSPEPSLSPPQPRQPLYEDSGVASSRGTSEDAKASASRGEAKDRSAEPKDQKARGRGKGGGQKKPLFEVLRFHKRAEETIVKTMRNQNSASLQPTELRAMSEMNPSVYHFYLDFVNYCCPSHMVQSDEQQWESLCKALKKHFEKDFGANQNQKPPQPQRPNNTLGDFITIETNGKAAKKNAKVTRGGGRVGRGSGRGDKKDDGQASGEFESPGGPDDSSAQSTSWVCPRCTLRNESLLLECAACGTSKQQAALWAEFPPLG